MRQRESFNSVAELYDAARPEYPTALVEDLARTCGLSGGSRVLEIGAGTGQLTVPLAARGVTITALELGSELAAIAGRRLARYENARIIVADFDHWSPELGSFDLVTAATSFHWLDGASRVKRCAGALSRGGRLAVVHTRWGVDGGGDQFAAASQACYAKWDPHHDDSFRPPRLDELPDQLYEITNDGLFKRVQHSRYPVMRTYQAKDFVNLLATFSNIIGLDAGRRRGFLGCIERLIHERFEGSVTRLDVYDMWIAVLA